MPDAPEHSYTVLRIKRKATEPPLSSLVIQDEPEDRTKIKKRRDITGRARGIFRLAETVPDTWEGRGEEGLSLRERIKALLSPPTKSAAPTNEVPMTPMTPLPPSLALPGKPLIPDLPPTVPAPSRRRSSGQQLQYRVVPPPKIHRQPMLPPKVITIEEEEAAKAALNFVDAEAVAGPSSPKRKASTKPVKASAKEEKEMEAFLPMLEEYLKLEESKASSSRVSAIRNGHSSDEEHYVYDLYYRDVRTVDSSSSLGFGVGDGVHIGALLGYTDDSPPSTPSDSEPEDEADEDSNDEDFYRNDYPEDEDADEDMVNYRDAFDDDEEEEYNRAGSDGSDRAGLSDNDDNDRDGNRGIWSYR